MESRYKKDNGYTYGEMITTQDNTTVEELTLGVFKKWNDRLEVMGSICDFYDYVWRFYSDGRLVLATTIDYNTNPSSCDWKGNNECGHLEYQSIDDMLRGWLDELKENESVYWFEDEIAFIESII